MHSRNKRKIHVLIVNTHTGWNMLEHFSAPMEMCMDDHLTQITERMQQQHLQNKTSNFSHAELPPGMENTPAFLGKQFLQGKRQSHVQTWKTCQPYYGTSPYNVMRKMRIHVHLYQEALLQADTLCSAYPHIQGKFHRISSNWRRKVPTQWHFQTSITMLRQPHM